MKVLLLGGTGAMGVALVQILSENGNEVWVTTRSARTSNKNVHYIQGNAHDIAFLETLLYDNYDAIVDFMVYTPNEFYERVELLLSSTKQYMFLSSSRVYADNGSDRITEDSPRLLDICTDKEYLQTDEYALAKAREENILFESKSNNWTIIRPYITYNDERLQLGVFEKENWLYRALNNKTIVFPKDISEKYTTLTYGYDVAKVMAELIGNEKTFGQAFHIASEQVIKWADVLNVYLDVIEKELGYRPKVYMPNDSSEIGKVCCNKYQICYDRLYNRSFSNEKIENVVKHKVEYTDVYEGLTNCLTNFINSNQNFKRAAISAKTEAYFDKLTKERTSLNEFTSFKAKLGYLLLRYTKLRI